MSFKYRYDDLTWPEIKDAVARNVAVLLPVGTIEDHGPHLPLNTDNLIVEAVCFETARRSNGEVLSLPVVPVGLGEHLMGFPGTVSVDMDLLLNYVAQCAISVARHGFTHIMLVNGHGSNTPLLDFVGRRVILETDALAASLMWWNLLRLDPDFIASFRESTFPGGAGHACEVETSMCLHLAPEKVQMDKAEDYIAWYNRQGATGFQWGDAFGAGPVTLVEWTSTFLENGVFGQPTLATADKGRRIMAEAANRMVEFVTEFQHRPDRPRVDHHRRPPTSPLPEA